MEFYEKIEQVTTNNIDWNFLATIFYVGKIYE